VVGQNGNHKKEDAMREGGEVRQRYEDACQLALDELMLRQTAGIQAVVDYAAKMFAINARQLERMVREEVDARIKEYFERRR